jgi:hypothetical protein
MTGRISVTEALGTIIHDVAENRISLGDVLETIKTWETDMDARALVSTHASTIGTKSDPMALRARGMHLAVLSLAVRLEVLMRSASVDQPAGQPSVTA